MRHIVLLVILNLLHSILPAQQDDPMMQIRELLINEKYEDLLSVTDSIMLPDSMKAELNYYRGQAFRELSMHDSALHSFQQALTRDSSNISYSKAVGKAYHSLGRTREAILVFEEVIMKDPLDRKSYLDLAGLYIIRKEYMKSLVLYRHLLQSDSLNYFLYKQAGKCYLATGPPDSVLYCFKKAFHLNPADPYLTQQIANIYLEKQQFDKSLATVQKGMEHDTSNSDLLRLRGYIWYLHDNYSLAIRDLEASASRDSSSAFTYKYLGLSFFKSERFDEARLALIRAYRLDPLDAKIIIPLGSACRWAGLLEEAIQYFQKAYDSFQPSLNMIKDIHIKLADTYRDLEQFENAIEAYKDALTYDNQDIFIFYRIAFVYDRYLDQKQNAIDYYERYVAAITEDQQPDDLEDITSIKYLEIAKSRINFLREELFFEE